MAANENDAAYREGYTRGRIDLLVHLIEIAMKTPGARLWHMYFEQLCETLLFSEKRDKS